MDLVRLCLDLLFRRLRLRQLNWNSLNRKNCRWLKTRNAPKMTTIPTVTTDGSKIIHTILIKFISSVKFALVCLAHWDFWIDVKKSIPIRSNSRLSFLLCKGNVQKRRMWANLKYAFISKWIILTLSARYILAKEHLESDHLNYQILYNKGIPVTKTKELGTVVRSTFMK